MEAITFPQNGKRLDVTDLLESIDYCSKDILYLGGSLIEGMNPIHSSNGMGNQFSDIDLFFLKDQYSIENSDAAYKNNLHSIRFLIMDGLKVDIEIISKSLMHSIIEQINSIDFNNNNLHTKNLILLPEGFDVYNMSTFLHRFITGIPIHNSDEYKSQFRLLNKSNYFRFMKRLSVNFIDTNFEDIIGNLNAHQYISAAIVAQRALIHAIKAYLFFNKVSVDRDKWVILKLSNFAGNNEKARKILDVFLQLYSFDFSKENKIKNQLQEVMIFLDEIVEQVSEGDGI